MDLEMGVDVFMLFVMWWHKSGMHLTKVSTKASIGMEAVLLIANYIRSTYIYIYP